MDEKNEWVKFFREQYPEGSRIRLRELAQADDLLPPRSMGTLLQIGDDCKFHVLWDNGLQTKLQIGQDSFSVLEPELTTLKLYMPLTAERIDPDYEDEDGLEPLYQHEICQYQDFIRSALIAYRAPEEAERGLMHWYGEDDEVDRKVKSAVFTVEERQGRLWGVAECRVAGNLKPSELSTLKDYIEGQASDGWGESFEQREFTAGDDDIYLHLWNSEEWSIHTEEELFSPKLAAGLPSLCFSRLEGTGELICIKRGEPGYYHSEWSTDNPVRNKELADYNNQRLGVTDAQRQAMEIGSMIGWDSPGADPAAYESSPQQDEGIQMGGM